MSVCSQAVSSSTGLRRLSYPRGEENQFEKPYSEVTAHMIDEEVRALVDAAYARTKVRVRVYLLDSIRLA